MNLSANLALIIVTALISFAAIARPSLRDRLMFTTKSLKLGQFERLLTHGFVHADFNHLFFNMFTLFFFGLVVERSFDQYFSGAYALFYLIAIVVAILPTVYAQRKNVNYASLGASGAVSAVLFYYVIKNPTSMLYLFAIVPIPALLFAIAFVGYGLYAQAKGQGRINHSAHLTGALFGVIAAVVL